MLDSYFHKDVPEKKAVAANSDDTIELNSEEEDDFVSRDQHVTQWYSEYLKSFERQYPGAFDKIVKRIMKGQEQYSPKKRNALRNVLGKCVTRPFVSLQLVAIFACSSSL